MLRQATNKTNQKASLFLLAMLNALPAYAGPYEFNSYSNLNNSFGELASPKVSPVNVINYNSAPAPAASLPSLPAAFTPVVSPAAGLAAVNACMTMPQISPLIAPNNLVPSFNSSCVQPAASLPVLPSSTNILGAIPAQVNCYAQDMSNSLATSFVTTTVLAPQTGAASSLNQACSESAVYSGGNYGGFQEQIGANSFRDYSLPRNLNHNFGSASSGGNASNGNGAGSNAPGSCVSDAVHGALNCAQNAARGAAEAAGNGSAGRPQGQNGAHPNQGPLPPNLPGLPAGIPGQILGTVVGVQQLQMQLTLFSSGNQVLQGPKGQVIGGDPGTMLSQDKDMVILHKGRLTIDSGNANTVVQTKLGIVTLNPQTIAVIDDQFGKALKVTALAGKEETLSLRSALTGEPSITTAKVGQELVLSTTGIEDEEFIPADGVESVVSGAVEKRPTLTKRTVSVSQIISRSARSRAGRSTRLAGTSPAFEKITAKSECKIWDLLDLKGNAPLQLVAQPGSKFTQTDDGKINLHNGALFIANRQELTLETAFARVESKRNALAMVEMSETGFRIKALSGPGDIKVVSGNSVTELAPGQELVVSRNALGKHELNPADAIARRERSANQLSGSLHYSLNEFSMTSMLHYPGYRQMVSNLDKSGKLIERILKTGVVVEMVTRARGKYAYSSLYNEQKIARDEKARISSAAIN